MSKECETIHVLTRGLERHGFPSDESKIPSNGIYILFENGEKGHHGDRIVRVGTHTGTNQLRSRLRQHFLNENKDRSIFRKNIGRALLNRNNDPFIEFWEIDLTSRKAKEKHLSSIDLGYQKSIEAQVSRYIQCNFTFCIFEVSEKEERLEIESKIISTVSRCDACKLDCTPEVRQIGLEQSARVFGFDKTVLQIPPAVCIQERNADVCGYKLLE